MHNLDHALDSMLKITNIFSQILALDNYTNGKEFIYILDKRDECYIKEHFSGVFDFALFVSSVQKRFVMVKAFDYFYTIHFTDITLDELKGCLPDVESKQFIDDDDDDDSPREPWK